MKLPINQILYLTIVGLFGLSGWQFYETLDKQRSDDVNARQARANKTTSERFQAGRDSKQVAKGPEYGKPAVWTPFKHANLIGKEPPPPEVEVDTGPKEPPPSVAKVETPLEDICEIVMLVYDGERSRAVIRYLPDAEIEVPEEILEIQRAKEGFGAGGAPPPTSTFNRPRNNRAAPKPAAMPVAAPMEGYIHQLKLDDKLWAPFSHIRLGRIDDYAEFAAFVRTVDGEEREAEKLFRDELELGQELQAKFDALRRREGGSEASGDPADPGDERSPIMPGENPWRGGPSGQRVGDQFHIGENDWREFQSDPNRIHTREIGTRSYSGGSIKGVQITKVSPRFQQMGLNNGDVIIAVNGQSVTSKAQAIDVGKKLYKRGQRTFEVTLLSQGREVTRTVVAPDK